MAKRMMTSFPDYGKAHAEYIVSLSEFLTRWPTEVVAVVCDPVDGIASRLTRIPYIADLREALEAETVRQRKHREFLAHPEVPAYATDGDLRRLQYHGLAALSADGRSMLWTAKGIAAGCPLDNLPQPPADYIAPYVPSFEVIDGRPRLPDAKRRQ